MVIKLIKLLIGNLSEEDREKLYDLLGVVVKSAAEGAIKGATQ